MQTIKEKIDKCDSININHPIEKKIGKRLEKYFMEEKNQVANNNHINIWIVGLSST